MKDTDRTCRCAICEKKIKYRLSIKNFKTRESRICLECAFYQKKEVKISVFVLVVLGIIIFCLDLICQNLVNENFLPKIISLIVSGTLVFAGVVYYLIFIFIKIFRKRISFKYKN